MYDAIFRNVSQAEGLPGVYGKSGAGFCLFIFSPQKYNAPRRRRRTTMTIPTIGPTGSFGAEDLSVGAVFVGGIRAL